MGDVIDIDARQQHGSIVSSDKCSEAEIIYARACGRFFVTPDCFGYVYREPGPRE